MSYSDVFDVSSLFIEQESFEVDVVLNILRVVWPIARDTEIWKRKVLEVLEIVWRQVVSEEKQARRDYEESYHDYLYNVYLEHEYEVDNYDYDDSEIDWDTYRDG